MYDTAHEDVLDHPTPTLAERMARATVEAAQAQAHADAKAAEAKAAQEAADASNAAFEATAQAMETAMRDKTRRTRAPLRGVPHGIVHATFKHVMANATTEKGDRHPAPTRAQSVGAQAARTKMWGPSGGEPAAPMVAKEDHETVALWQGHRRRREAS